MIVVVVVVEFFIYYINIVVGKVIHPPTEKPLRNYMFSQMYL